MFCPKCRDEFQPEIATCPDCRVDLVDQLEAPAEVELVTAAEVRDAALFPVFKSLLEASGLPYSADGEEMLSVYPGPAGTLVGPIKIRVPREHEEEVRQLLAAAESGSELAEGSLGGESDESE